MTGSSTSAEAKQALRRTLLARLSALSPEARRASDGALFTAFLALPQAEEADALFLFWGVPGREPETERLVRALTARGKRVGLPRMLPGRGMEVRLFQPEGPLVRAPFGLWEPPEDAPLLDKSSIQLALVPAVCYDRAGYRLGFGGGYYDRWLADFSGFTAGLCRGRVLQDRVPREPHDRRVDLVLTEEGPVLP